MQCKDRNFKYNNRFKRMFLKGSLSIIICFIIQTVLGQYKDVSQLLTDLQKGYRKEVLPTRTARSYVAVKVYPAIVRINNLDERKEELSSTISLTLYWTDDRLSWDPRECGGVTEVYMPASSIWLPDILVHNTISAPEPFKDQLVEVSSLGNILYVKNVLVNSYCHVDLNWFPRDQHTCQIIFSSWIYSSKKMLMEFMHVNISTADIHVLADTDPNIINVDNQHWQLVARKARAEINMITYACCLDESYFQLKIILTVKRNVSCFKCITDFNILPMIVITVLVPFQFILPKQSSSRHMFGLFLLFGECLPLMLSSSYIPANSSLPFIGTINLVCILLTTLALVGSIIISKICSCKMKQLPYCLQNILRKVTTKNSSIDKNQKRVNNFNRTGHDGLLHENHYIELDVIDTSNEPNGVMNIPNGRSNESNGLTNRVNNIEVTANTQGSDSDSMNLTLVRILNELKQIHSSTCDNLKRKDKNDLLNFASYLDKLLFYVFFVLFIIIFIVLIIILLF